MAGIQLSPGFLLCQTSISDYGSSYAAVGLLQMSLLGILPSVLSGDPAKMCGINMEF